VGTGNGPSKQAAAQAAARAALELLRSEGAPP
jgi:dsRNA-specific ribonuclease